MVKRKADSQSDVGLDSGGTIPGVDLLEAPAKLTECVVADWPTGAGSPSWVTANRDTTSTVHVAE